MNHRVVRRQPLVSLLGVLGMLCASAPQLMTAAQNVQPATPAPTTLAKDHPFKAVAAVPEKVSAGETFLVRYTIYPLKDHYLYKEATSLKLDPVPGVTWGPVQFSPAPELKHDTFEDRDMEIYHQPVTLYVEAKVDAKAALGARTVKTVVSYRGCNPSVCFFPTKENFSSNLEVVKKVAAVEGASSSEATASNQPAAGVDAAGGVGGAGAPGASAAPGVPAANGSQEAPGAPVASGSSVAAGAAGAPGASAAGGAPVASGAPAGEAPVVATADGAGGMDDGSGDARDSAAAGAALTRSLPPPSEGAGSSVSAATGASSAATGIIDEALGHGLVWTFIIVFGLGIAASFTPCVYPIIPITMRVLGARQARSRWHGFSLALVYVLGLSTVYTVLGVTAASTGALFGSLMQSKWLVGSIAVLFIMMGFGTLGVFNVALPSGITSRLSGGVQARGYPGVFLMGAIAGLVASPCVGPVIVSLLVFIARTKDLVLGSALMFTFAFGMGQLFLLLGTFAVSLPKSGEWMDTVKGALALVIFGAGFYYLNTIIPAGYYELLIGVAAVVAGTFVGAFHPLSEEASTGWKVRKVAGILFVVVGIYSVLGGLIGTRLVAPQVADLFHGGGADSAQDTRDVLAGSSKILWDEKYAQAMGRARNDSKPVLLDFTAGWCAACKELEHNTYTDKRVVSAAQEFVTIKVDGTEGTPEFTALKSQYGVVGLPTVLFLGPDGKPLPELTVTGFVPPEDFLRRMCQVQGLQASRLTNVCRG